MTSRAILPTKRRDSTHVWGHTRSVAPVHTLLTVQGVRLQGPEVDLLLGVVLAEATLWNMSLSPSACQLEPYKL